MSDPLIDALLKETAAQKGDDESFLERVENALDLEEPRKPKRRKAMLLIPALLGVLVMGVGLSLLTHKQVPTHASYIVATESENYSDSGFSELRSKNMKTSESPRFQTQFENRIHESITEDAELMEKNLVTRHSLSDTELEDYVQAELDQRRTSTEKLSIQKEYAATESPTKTNKKRDNLPQNSRVFAGGGTVGPTSEIGLDFGFAVPSTRSGEANQLENPALSGLRRSLQESHHSRYAPLIDNEWTSPTTTPLSTFSIDVDTASWTNLRNMIRDGATLSAIPKDSVRIEELVNYFRWTYPQPSQVHPFTLSTETTACPWDKKHRLLRIGVQGKKIVQSTRPKANLVFLLDVSGSMNQPNKLPLVQQAISVLVDSLEENDRITIVVYAGSEGLALPPTDGSQKETIREALDRLSAGGSTNGGAGIKLAYDLAKKQFIKDGINRVILCTDGDFNVGVTGTEELTQLVESGADKHISISVLGFGQDNLNDSMLETITNKGDGNYFFIDSFSEARKVFLNDLMGTLVTIAKDVKIQIEFNPSQVSQYRLIGYANRRLKKEDFDNDQIDAGDIGSGHSVTALYEIAPAHGAGPSPDHSDLRYQTTKVLTETEPSENTNELAFLKLRYKKPDTDSSILIEQVVSTKESDLAESIDQQFASAVSLLGLILRQHDSAKEATLDEVIALAKAGLGVDPKGYRAEFIDVVNTLKNNSQ